jgi:Zn-dependent peptidase ImmA (M78 family)
MMATPIVAESNPFSLVEEAQQSVPVNVEALARQFGLRVKRLPMAESIAGVLSRETDGWTLTVNAEHTDSRQRFTIAHEIGHFVLHRDRLGDGTNDSTDYAVTSDAAHYNDAIGPGAERDANQFATAVLMPEARILDVCETFRCNDPEPIARLFRVSPHAMRTRMAYLRERGRL